MSVIYEYCNGYSYLDQLTAIGSKDWGFIGERLARDVTYFATEWKAMMNKKKQFVGVEVQEPKQTEQPESE